MSLYDIAYVTWPVLLALLVAVPGVLLFSNRRAWKNGYDQGRADAQAEFKDSIKKSFEAAARLSRPLSRVDPDTAHY